MTTLPEDMTQTLEATLTMEPEGKKLSTCRAHAEQNRLTITGWYTEPGYQHHHFGSAVMKNVVERFFAECVTDESKIEILYIWNGQNLYIKDWLTSMKAKKTESIAEQKYNQADTWANHMYAIPWKALKKKLEIGVKPLII